MQSQIWISFPIIDAQIDLDVAQDKVTRGLRRHAAANRLAVGHVGDIVDGDGYAIQPADPISTNATAKKNTIHLGVAAPNFKAVDLTPISRSSSLSWWA